MDPALEKVSIVRAGRAKNLFVSVPRDVFDSVTKRLIETPKAFDTLAVAYHAELGVAPNGSMLKTVINSCYVPPLKKTEPGEGPELNLD